jgi:hypothetical protein
MRFAVPHEQADDLVSLGAQQVRGDAAIDSSGHGQYDARHRLRLALPSGLDK